MNSVAVAALALGALLLGYKVYGRKVATWVGLDPDMTTFGNFSALGGFEAMSQLLARPDPPTAVFALSDEMAMGAMRAALDAGLSVPEDVSIVGFDDHELAFALGLTTVAQDPADLGAKGAELLVDRLSGHLGPPREVHSRVHLETRASTARI